MDAMEQVKEIEARRLVAIEKARRSSWQSNEAFTLIMDDVKWLADQVKRRDDLLKRYSGMVTKFVGGDTGEHSQAGRSE